MEETIEYTRPRRRVTLFAAALLLRKLFQICLTQFSQKTINQLFFADIHIFVTVKGEVRKIEIKIKYTRSLNINSHIHSCNVDLIKSIISSQPGNDVHNSGLIYNFQTVLTAMKISPSVRCPSGLSQYPPKRRGYPSVGRALACQPHPALVKGNTNCQSTLHIQRANAAL